MRFPSSLGSVLDVDMKINNLLIIRYFMRSISTSEALPAIPTGDREIFYLLIFAGGDGNARAHHHDDITVGNLPLEFGNEAFLAHGLLKVVMFKLPHSAKARRMNSGVAREAR